MIMDADMKNKKLLTPENEVIDFWNNLTESTKQSIQRGLEQSKKGETTPHEKVMANIKAKNFSAS